MEKYENLLEEKIINIKTVNGGCIANSFRAKTKKGTYFIKEYGQSGIVLKEINGLKEIEKYNIVKTPKIINFTDKILVLEFIKSSKPNTNCFKLLGKQLALLHRHSYKKFGFFENNFIGNTVQINSYKESWVEFYTINRLDYQISLLQRYEDIVSTYTLFRKLIPEIIGSSNEKPCLIHGDLWSGNIIMDNYGEPVVFDPAVYYGNRELELVITDIFGGFPKEFYNSYQEHYPLKEGWKERKNLYRLYHILNHLNLFGISYKLEALQLMNNYL